MEYSTRGGGHGFSRVETETLHTEPFGAINTTVDGATGRLPGTADHQTPSPTPGGGCPTPTMPGSAQTPSRKLGSATRTKTASSSALKFTATLEDASVAISMDGRGRCMDNIFIERLWRPVKYQAVYLHELSDGFQVHRVIARWIEFYNTQRPLSALADSTPVEAYDKEMPMERQAEPAARPRLRRLNRNGRTCKTEPWRHDRTSGIHLNCAAPLSSQVAPPQSSYGTSSPRAFAPKWASSDATAASASSYGRSTSTRTRRSSCRMPL